MKYKSKHSSAFKIAFSIVALIFMLNSIFDNNLLNLSQNIIVRRGALIYNTSNTWNYNFQHLNGVAQGYFKAKSSNDYIIYSGTIIKGDIVFNLHNNKDSLLTSFRIKDNIDTLFVCFKKGEVYKICAIASEARGDFKFKMESP